MQAINQQRIVQHDDASTPYSKLQIDWMRKKYIPIQMQFKSNSNSK